jgi:S1-C subfamily serine protease
MTMFAPRLLLLGSLLPVLLPAQTPAQTPAPTSAPASAAIDDAALVQRIEGKAGELRLAGKLLSVDVLRAQASERHTCALQLPVPVTTPLSSEAVCARARKSSLIVGHYYACKECSQWHFTAASGFAVADGVVATCWHLLADDPEMPGACLLVADFDGGVWPVQEVLAGDAKRDVCLVRIDHHQLVPLPLRSDVRAGERVYCFSNPDHQFAFFSEGILARRYRESSVSMDPHAPKPDAKSEAKPEVKSNESVEWLHITADFARGSSGGAVLDAQGNVVGMAQATVTIVHDEDAERPDTQMIAKSAAPAAALAALVVAPAK